ncbi:MAG: S8 family serine peptidase [Pseudomonadota bacterium]
MPSDIPSLSYGSADVGGDDRFRPAEISASNLTPGTLASLTGAGFQVIRSNDTGALGAGLAARLRTPRDLAPNPAIQLARQIAPNAVFDFSHIYGPSVGAETYARAMVNMPARGRCVASGTIGLIDTRVVDHPALDEARIEQRSFSESRPSGLHGTAVASIIAGDHPDGPSLIGDARLLVANVFSVEERTLVADAIDLVAALGWMIEGGARVVNMSLAGPPNDLVADAVARGAEQGLIIVAAAGNGGRRAGPRYPAAYEEVIATAAVDARGRPYRLNSSGDHIDVAAPGVDVWGADSRNDGGALWSGTSFAAPLVTAEVAAAYDQGLVRTVEEARAFLAGNARDLGKRGRDPDFGAGLLQIVACR